MLTICKSIHEITASIANQKYENIYISIGSKYNEEFIYMTNKTGKQQTKWSNAMEQIAPHFYREKENSLILCVDSFNPQELEKNKSKIREIVLLSDIILYDTNNTIQSIEEFISYMTNYFIEKEILPEKVLIANYVRFISPNHTENYFEENIPKVIYKGLTSPSLPSSSIVSYNTRFFQWFGYQPHTYHLLFNYHNYKYMVGYTNILYLLNDIYDEDYLSYSNIYMLQKINSKISPMYLEIFLKNVMDITAPFDISLYDYFIK